MRLIGLGAHGLCASLYLAAQHCKLALPCDDGREKKQQSSEEEKENENEADEEDDDDD